MSFPEGFLEQLVVPIAAAIISVVTREVKILTLIACLWIVNEVSFKSVFLFACPKEQRFRKNHKTNYDLFKIEAKLQQLSQFF